MADDNEIKQDEIEQLLKQAGAGPAVSASDSGPAGDTASGPAASSDSQPPMAGAAPGFIQPSQSSQFPGTADPMLAQGDIENLLAGSAMQGPVVQAAGPPCAPAPPAAGSSETFAAGDIDYLLNQASRAIDSVSSGLDSAPAPGVRPFELEDFAGAPPSTESTTIDLIRDVELDLKIELGRTNMYLDDVLRLRKGSVVPLDKMAGDPVDIYVNGRLIARGEVLVLNDNFCVRVAELITGVAPAA